MRFYHQTSPHYAQRIIRTKKFNSCNMEADHGLNGYTNVRQVNRQHLEGVGAELVLEWLGPIRETNVNEMRVSQMQKNVLYSQFTQSEIYGDKKRWREFIPAPMNENLLKIVNIRFVRGSKIDDLISYPNWYRYIPLNEIKINFKRKFKLKFIKELRDEYINQELFLKIQ